MLFEALSAGTTTYLLWREDKQLFAFLFWNTNIDRIRQCTLYIDLIDNAFLTMCLVRPLLSVLNSLQKCVFINLFLRFQHDELNGHSII